TDQWVRAFSPGRDRSGLELTGNQQLAEALLDALAGSGRRPAAGAQAAA
ncbi:MAG: hypothetical protein JO262_10225, partial [Solirubrobacterales bacterium]|nr:hypothetical protein [Solirubrobacterales bacterium]